jgi:hypothetical protein
MGTDPARRGYAAGTGGEGAKRIKHDFPLFFDDFFALD